MAAYLVLQAGLKYVLVLWLIVYLGRSQDCMPLQVGERIVVTGLKNLGRVGTHFFMFFFLENNFMHFERHFAFQNA